VTWRKGEERVRGKLRKTAFQREKFYEIHAVCVYLRLPYLRTKWYS
jgi:hypothetical protein